MALPFANSPEFQTEREVGASSSLHEVAEIVSIAGITPEDVVSVACLRLVGLHAVVSLGLLFAGLHFVYGTGFEGLASVINSISGVTYMPSRMLSAETMPSCRAYTEVN